MDRQPITILECGHWRERIPSDVLGHHADCHSDDGQLMSCLSATTLNPRRKIVAFAVIDEPLMAIRRRLEANELLAAYRCNLCGSTIPGHGCYGNSEIWKLSHELDAQEKVDDLFKGGKE